MKNRSNFLIYALLLTGVFIVFASSCKKDDDEQQDPVASLSEDAVVIEDTDWENSIVSYDTENYTFIFNDNIEDMNLKTGDIIVTAADEGILRKVSEISDEEGTIIVQTEDADLEDVIENGEVDVEQALTVSDLKSIDYHYEGISLNPSCMKQLDNTNFTWDVNAVIHDADGIDNGPWDQIILVGQFSCSWDVYMNIKISWFKLKKLRVGFEASENLDLTLLASLGYDFEKSITLMTVNFNSFTVFIGQCPVVITPKLEINAGISGSAVANITTSVSQSLSFDAGIEYNKGAGWSSDTSENYSFDYSPPELHLNAEAVAFLGPKLILKLYGIAGPYISTKIYGKLEADLLAYPSSPWWTLYGGLDLSAGVRVKIFGKTFTDKDFVELIEYEKKIAQSTTSPPEIPVVSTTDVTDITEVSAIGGGNITHDGGYPVTSRGVCWSTGQTPTISDNFTSDGTGTGSFVSNISGLTANTTYYVSAYATNSAGTGYGDVKSFTTEGGTIVVTLDNVASDIEAYETWTESDVILSLQEYNGDINFEIQTDCIWLFGCLLHADLSGVQGTIEEVEVDVLDGCGGNSLVAKLFDNGVEIADAVSANGESTLSLINPNPGVDIPDVLTVSGICEAKVSEIRIIFQPN